MERLQLQWILLIPFLTFSALAQSITLSQFQQISGFPLGCTQAYNTPIQGCTAKDFTANNQCSAACIDGLTNLQVLLNTACKGITASTSTLIGLFFDQQGVQALCPSASSGGQTTTTLQQLPPPAVSSASTPPSTLQTTTSAVQSPPPQPPSSTAPAQSSSSSVHTTQAPSSSMVTANPNPTPPSITQTASSPLPTFTLSSAQSATSSSPTTTSSADPNAFGGSVNPFGASTNAAPSATADSFCFFASLVAGVAFYALLI